MAFRFHELPPDVFLGVTAMLNGCDLLSLSHVNKVLLNDLLGPSSDVWTERLLATEATDVASAKQWYCTRRAVRFPGLTHAPREQVDNAGAFNIPVNVAKACAESSFSISLWFALDPPLTDLSVVSVGGVLLGAQNTRWTNPRWEECHTQFIHVDPERNLYCSVTDSKEVVASNLETGRWHHLVLTFSRHVMTRPCSQVMYLDGERVHSSTGPLHAQWIWMDCWQLGIGAMNGGTQGEPSSNFVGWYGFRGLMDAFTVHDWVLSSTDIKSLTRGGRIGKDGVVWSQRVAQVSGKPRDMKDIIPVGYSCCCGIDGCWSSTVCRQQRQQDTRKGRRRFRRFWRSAEAS